MFGMELERLQREVERLARVIGAPPEYLPTYCRSDDGARPHIEFQNGHYHFVVEERGVELQRITSPNPQDILYEVFSAVTHQMASDYEVRHRRQGEDSRRQLFDVQLQLLGTLSDSWRQRCSTHMDDVLRRHPFSAK